MRSTVDKLRKLHHRAQGICTYCRRLTALVANGTTSATDIAGNGLAATIDHKVPQARGGTWQWTNIVLACARCNNLKGDMLPYAWDRYMRDNPRWWIATASE